MKGNKFLFSKDTATHLSLTELRLKVQEIKSKINDFFQPLGAVKVISSKDVLAGQVSSVEFSSNKLPTGFKKSKLGENYGAISIQSKAGKEIQESIDKFGCVSFQDLNDVIGYEGDSLLRLEYINTKDMYVVSSVEEISISSKDATLTTDKEIKKITSSNSTVIPFLSSLSELNRVELLSRVQQSEMFRMCIKKHGAENTRNEFGMDEQEFKNATLGVYDFNTTTESKLKYLVNQ